jgi:hypothetical protein
MQQANAVGQLMHACRNACVSSGHWSMEKLRSQDQVEQAQQS